MPLSLNERIAKFYDDSSPVWLEVWGDHMHHGYYGPDGTERKPRREAQLDLIDKLIEFANLEEVQPKRILDAGCGVGGSSRYLAGYFNAEVLGVTLSPFQAERGNAFAKTEGADHLVNIEARDVYTLKPGEGYDVIWSLESAEHMPEKKRLIQHFYSLLKPGGKLAMITWCHRNEPPNLGDSDHAQLEKLCELYHLPPWISPAEYLQVLAEAGFENIISDDWSKAVAPFWAEVIKSTFTWQGLQGLLKSGLGTIKGAWAMQYMQSGFRSGLIKFAVFSAQKPEIR